MVISADVAARDEGDEAVRWFVGMGPRGRCTCDLYCTEFVCVDATSPLGEGSGREDVVRHRTRRRLFAARRARSALGCPDGGADPVVRTRADEIRVRSGITFAQGTGRALLRARSSRLVLL